MSVQPALILAAAALALGCGSKKNSNMGGLTGGNAMDMPPPEAELKKGVADENTWQAVAGYNAKIKIPSGWRWGQKGALVMAFHGQNAGVVVLGGKDQKDAVAKGKEARESLKLTLGTALATDGVHSKLNGLDITRWDYEQATQEGNPASGVLIVGVLPDKRFIVLLAYVHNGANQQTEELRDALNTLSADGVY